MRPDERGPEAGGARYLTKITARDLNVFYGEKQALFDVNLDISENTVTALIGPSGCGKSTFIRCVNRMNDVVPSCRVEGKITLDGDDIYGDEIDVVQLRARIGMVFQKPNPFPKSVWENVAYGPKIHGLARSRAIEDTNPETAGCFHRARAESFPRSDLSAGPSHAGQGAGNNCGSATRIPSSPAACTWPRPRLRAFPLRAAPTAIEAS